MDCMVARERTAGARRECLDQMFRRHVPDGREVRRCVGPVRLNGCNQDQRAENETSLRTA